MDAVEQATRSGALVTDEIPACAEPVRSDDPGPLPELGRVEKQLLAGRLEALTGRAARLAVARKLHGIRTRPTDANPEGVERSMRIRNCMRTQLAHNPNTGQYAYAPLPCGDALCPSCQQRKQKRYAFAISHHIESDPGKVAHLRFLTLTQPKAHASQEQACDAADRLMGSLHRLTNRKGFRAAVAGGIRSMEIVYRSKGERVGGRYDERTKKWTGGYRVPFAGWHVHLHLLAELDWSAHLRWGTQALLDRIELEWCGQESFEEEYSAARLALALAVCPPHRGREVTAASPGSKCSQQELDPEPLRSKERAASYVAKYVTKPLVLKQYKLREFAQTMVNRRHIEGWGSMRDFRAVLRETLRDDWAVLNVSIDELVALAAERLKVQVVWRDVAGVVYSSTHGQTMGGIVRTKDVPAHQVLLEIALDARCVQDRRKGERPRACEALAAELGVSAELAEQIAAEQRERRRALARARERERWVAHLRALLAKHHGKAGELMGKKLETI